MLAQLLDQGGFSAADRPPDPDGEAALLERAARRHVAGDELACVSPAVDQRKLSVASYPRLAVGMRIHG